MIPVFAEADVKEIARAAPIKTDAFFEYKKRPFAEGQNKRLITFIISNLGGIVNG